MARETKRDSVGRGALVLSLDFELHWGVRDHVALDAPYVTNLYGARKAVPAMLDVFTAYDVGCTWAIVGFLFARTREELVALRPHTLPRYRERCLDPYVEAVGENEATDPLHFAPSLIEQIGRTPHQEIGTHTHSHYYCLETGQNAEAFAADLASARAGAAGFGVELRSIVYPRNQRNPCYDQLLVDAGIVAYRGQPRGWIQSPRTRGDAHLAYRLVRLAEAHAPVGPSNLVDWGEIAPRGGLCDVRASFFLRPLGRRFAALQELRVIRLQRAIVCAAQSGRVVHLWWHPHNFGLRLETQIAMLRRLLDTYAACRARYGMLSLTMAGAAALAAAARDG